METHVASTANNSHFEGWLSKYQIADIEKLPHDHHLVQNMLAQLPAKQHHSKAWPEDNELEYCIHQQQGDAKRGIIRHMASRQLARPI